MDKCPEDISGSGTLSFTSRFELLPEIGLGVTPSFLIFYALTVLSFMVSHDLAISAAVRDGHSGSRDLSGFLTGLAIALKPGLQLSKRLAALGAGVLDCDFEGQKKLCEFYSTSSPAIVSWKEEDEAKHPRQ